MLIIYIIVSFGSNQLPLRFLTVTVNLKLFQSQFIYKKYLENKKTSVTSLSNEILEKAYKRGVKYLRATKI